MEIFGLLQLVEDYINIKKISNDYKIGLSKLWIINEKVSRIIVYRDYTIIFFSCEKDVSFTEPTREIPIETLIISSTPSGAKIYENGRNTGRYTPDTLGWMEKQEYQFLLRLQNYRDTSFSVDFSNNDSIIIEIEYHKNPKMLGSILCNPEDRDAKIYLDGESTNQTTPSTLTNIIPGIHEITYKKENYREKTVELLVKSNHIVEDRSDLIDTSKWVDYSTQTSTIASDYLTCIEIDSKGDFWIGSSDNGIIHFNGSVFKNYNSGNSILKSDFINNIEIDSDGRVWVSTYDGLFSFNGINWEKYDYNIKFFPTNVINDIKIDKKGNYWVATQRGILMAKEGNFDQWDIFFEVIHVDIDDPIGVQPDLKQLI